MKVELNLCNYIRKSELWKQLVLIHQNWQKKPGLASLKSDVDELGIQKLRAVPVDLSNVVM